VLNVNAYGKSPVPGLGVLGVSGLNIEDLIKQGKGKLSDLTGEDLEVPDIPDMPTKKELEEIAKKPSQDLAKQIGSELATTHGEATGTAAAKEIWAKAKPFAIVGAIGLGAIMLILAVRKK
jgi:hypothetical protein